MSNRLILTAEILNTVPASDRLDNLTEIFNPEVPQTEIGVAEAFTGVPAPAKIAAFIVSATSVPFGRVFGYTSAEQRPVSVRTGGLSRAGERCSAFFCTL